MFLLINNKLINTDNVTTIIKRESSVEIAFDRETEVFVCKDKRSADKLFNIIIKVMDERGVTIDTINTEGL